MTQPRLLGGRYELDGVVGRGGMAEVYRARDLRLDRVVAVKTLREDLARDATFQARFRREAQSAASLNHPSIVAVYDTGEDNSSYSAVPFIVMEYVDGRTIRDLLRDDRRLLPERALEITDGILRALDYSHRNGIVHRDIKPGNVMLTRHGEIKVMDFGIARAVADTQATMTQTAQVIGTAQYLSPEQARGERVDARSDIYAVGCVLYELLTGRPPFTGDSPVAIAYQHVRENPVPPTRVDPELPAWADNIVLRAMAKDPAQRYQSAADMRGDIQRALSGYPVAGPPPPVVAGYGGAGGGTRRMVPTGATALQGPTGALPPYEYAQDTGPRGTQRRHPVWPWITAVVALLAIGAVAAVYYTINGTGSGTPVPSVVGLKLADAEKVVTNAGFIPIPSPQKSLTGPYGKVTSTNPQFGTKEPKGTHVVLRYNFKPGPKVIPSVRGDSVPVATQLLTKDGWRVQQGATPVASIKVQKGNVVSTSPAVGTSLALGQTITLNISGGGVTVPNVVGLPVAQAKAAIIAKHLIYTVISNQQGPPGTVPGTVWQTSPANPKVVLPQSLITLYVEPGSSSPSPTPTSSSPSPTPSPPF
jgi:beta-lactam-binding protein with PASTA domain/tRNA A-37 threonylcarbamoyl transferase component Bud32